MHNVLEYKIDLDWIGSVATEKRFKYDKTYQLSFKNKPTIIGSADPIFHGNAELYNPEEMLLSALASCHMMSFFYLCGKEKIKIDSYSDQPLGVLKINPNGSGQFEEVTLNPTIKTEETNLNKITELFTKAGDYCFIARSCNFRIIHKPNILYK